MVAATRSQLQQPTREKSALETFQMEDLRQSSSQSHPLNLDAVIPSWLDGFVTTLVLVFGNYRDSLNSVFDIIGF
jgi:hypothetical protein